MTDGDNLSDEVLDFYKQLSGLDTTRVELKRLSSAKRARFISFCRSKGVNPSVYSDSEKPDVSSPHVSEPSRYSSNLEVSGCIGLDMVAVMELFPTEIKDFKGDSSITRIFDMREIAYAETKDNPHETLAGIFAAKEAIVKTGQLDLYREQNFDKLVVEHDETGMPNVPGFSVSISHCSGFAVAVAVPSLEALRVENSEPNQHGQSKLRAEDQALKPESIVNSQGSRTLVRTAGLFLFLLAFFSGVYVFYCL